MTSANSLSWGETFQVTTTLQNLGAGDAGPFIVRFLLIGENGQLNSGIYLGDAQVPGLAAGYDQPLVQTLQLPSRVPAGMSLNSVGYARIAVLVNAEDTVNESLISNNLGESAPITVRLPGTNGTSVVPTDRHGGSVAVAQAPKPAPKTKPHPKRAEARARREAARSAQESAPETRQDGTGDRASDHRSSHGGEKPHQEIHLSAAKPGGGWKPAE